MDESGGVREKRKPLLQSHRDHSQASYSTHHMTHMIPPFPHPHMGMFPDGRPPHIHLNPALYPPPRLGSHAFYWGRPPRPFHGPTKRYSAQHRARSRTAPTAKDSSMP